jgi:hypothetical protein
VALKLIIICGFEIIFLLGVLIAPKIALEMSDKVKGRLRKCLRKEYA